MSGISSRKIYDDCYQSNRVNQETGPGSYKVNIDQVGNEKCFVQTGTGNNVNNFWYNPTDIKNINFLSDIESHLKNLDLPDSRCLEGKTLIEKNIYANYLSKNIQSSKKTCSQDLDLRNTRLENSLSEVKMLTQNRFDFPIIDPRAYVYYGYKDSEQNGSNRFGVNTRQQAKNMKAVDYYKKINIPYV